MADKQIETIAGNLTLNPLSGEEDEAGRLCTCQHRLFQHMASPVGCRWAEGEQICSCSKFVRAHLGRRSICWCTCKTEEVEHPAEVFYNSSYVQKALDAVRDDLALLKLQLESWGNTEDLNARVENWHYNAWRKMEEILKEG